MLNEISTNRILGHFTDGSTLAIISTYRTERTDSENYRLLRELKSWAKAHKLGFTELKSRWVEQNPDGSADSSDERSLIIYGISLDDTIRLGGEYQQSSVIYKDKNRCAEVCTTTFTDYEGKAHKVGNVVRTFNVGGASPFNLADAEEIFGKRKGGPASMPIKSNRPFRLAEVFEVESPRGSNFSDGKERYTQVAKFA